MSNEQIKRAIQHARTAEPVLSRNTRLRVAELTMSLYMQNGHSIAPVDEFTFIATRDGLENYVHVTA